MHQSVTLLLLGFKSAYLAFPLGKSPERPQPLISQGCVWEIFHNLFLPL